MTMTISSCAHRPARRQGLSIGPTCHRVLLADFVLWVSANPPDSAVPGYALLGCGGWVVAGRGEVLILAFVAAGPFIVPPHVCTFDPDRDDEQQHHIPSRGKSAAGAAAEKPLAGVVRLMVPVFMRSRLRAKEPSFILVRPAPC